MATIPTDDGLGEKVTIMDLQISQRPECFQVDRLATMFIWRLFHDAGEVLCRYKRLIWFEHLACHFLNVEPVETPPPFGAQAKVEIEAVNICDDSFHTLSLRSSSRSFSKETAHP